MKRFWLPLLFAAALLPAGGCALFGRTLEYSEMISPEVSTAVYPEGAVLKISGTCGHSAYVVEKIRQIKEGRTLAVEVLISPFSRDGYSGSFKTEVFLDDFDFVVFGAGRTLLWRRYPAEPPSNRNKPVFVPETR